MTAVRVLLTGLIDYAGLFPPAGLDMAKAVENYAAYQSRPDQWALGRFVLPVARLDAFAAVLEALPADVRRGARWPVTALLGGDPVADMCAVSLFNERHAAGGPQVLSLEGKASSVAQVYAVRAPVPASYDLYLELPLTPELQGLVDAVKDAGAFAKIRTGGVQATDIPAPEAVLAFLTACADAALPFKATAGLHHPVRGRAPLTYLTGSAGATMFGYLNVFLAASALWHERPESEVRALLTRDEGQTLRFGPDALQWGGIRVSAEELAATRRDFAHTMGSCSFLEPVTEIGQLGARLEAVPT
ncbi:MAG: hypothetical protein SGJ01_01875 [Gemmatimonadota bacterium]|nr:hypothetical protein [Gemmatimonadota bacterium]